MELKELQQTYKAVTLFEGKEPIGCADIEVVGDDIWLNHFAIREDYRGKGYGQRALLTLIEFYKVNTLTCAVKNDVAFHIYKKHGFEIVEEGYAFAEGRVYIMKRS